MWKRDGGGENLEREIAVRKRRDYYNISSETWYFGTLVEAVRMEKRDKIERSQKAVEIPKLSSKLI